MTTRSEICAAGPIGSASSVCTYWQGSPAHYANIMEPSFTSMGVGCWFCSTAEGQYTYWTVNVEQGSCAISLYPRWQYSYVPIGSEKTRKSISGAELVQSLGGVVQVGTSESSLARRVANVERRAGIANAQELGKLLGSMADNGLHSAADFDKQISAYQREEMELRNEIAELRSKSKTYAAAAHNLQVCHTYKSVWLEFTSKPLALKDTFYKQNEVALQAYSRAASQLDKMGISLGTEPEKVRQLVTETESRIADLIAELEIVCKTNRDIQEDKEKVEQIQSG